MSHEQCTRLLGTSPRERYIYSDSDSPPPLLCRKKSSDLLNKKAPPVTIKIIVYSTTPACMKNYEWLHIEVYYPRF